MSLGYAGIGNILERRTATEAGHPDFHRDYALDRLSHACKYAALTLKAGNVGANEHFKVMAAETLKDLKRDKRSRELQALIDSEESRAS